MVKLLIRFIPLIIFISLISKNIPSLIIEIAMTMISGAQAVSGLIGEMTLMDRRIETTKK
jgi:hypothetical protein